MRLDLRLGPLSLSLGKEKTLSPDMSAWVRAEDVPADGEGAKLISPYTQSSWIYIAVNRLAQKLAAIPFRISRIKKTVGGSVSERRARGAQSVRRRSLGEDVLDSGDVVDLFESPHPTMNKELFWEMFVTWLALRGEVFVLPLDAADSPVDLSERKPRVERLITLPTELFWHIVVGYQLEAWRYTGSPLLTPIPSEMLLPGQVIHSRVPNPYLYWRGMSPILVAWIAAGADYAATQYSKGYWLNNADTGMVVTTDQQATPEQQAAILAALRERKRKAGTADRPLFLWGGAKVEKPTLNGMETQFIETRKMNRQEIAAIWNVPDSIMGFSEAKASALSGGANALEQDQIAFIENAVMPLGMRAEAAMAPVIRTFGDDLVGWFDYDALPVMQAARRDRLDAAAKAFALGAAFNDINQLYDLGFPEYEYGDNNYLPFNLQDANAEPEPMPSEDPGAAPQPPESGDQPDRPDSPDQSEPPEKENTFSRLLQLVGLRSPSAPPNIERRSKNAQLWKSHMLARRKSIKLVQGKVKKVLHEFRAQVLAKLDHVHLQDNYEPGRSRGDEALTKSLIDLIFNPHKFADDLVSELHNPLHATLDLAASELLSEIGKSDDPWKLPPAEVLEFLRGRTQEIKGCGQTVRDQLNTTLEEGVKNGETHQQLADRVRVTFGNLQQYESKRIAMTEVNTAYNFSRHAAMKHSGIGYKTWLSSHGPNVREAHAQAEDDYGPDDAIPLDEPFVVDGEDLMYPGDPEGSPGNIINCQCVQLPAAPPKSAKLQITNSQ